MKSLVFAATLAGFICSLSIADAQRASAPSQSSVALKAIPATIAATNAQVKSALAATDVAKATALSGKPASVQATVTKTYSPASNALVILDLAKDYHDTITAVAFSASYAKLPDLEKLTGQHILVTGPVTMYHGKPEIVLSTASQIRLIR